MICWKANVYVRACPQKTSAVRGVAQCGYFAKWGEAGSSDADAALFNAKKFGFLKFMVCPHGQGGRG